MSLFVAGFVPGDGLSGRIATMTDPATWASADARAALTAGLIRARDVQRSVVRSARKVFGGRITYAAGTWEDVEWDLFDIVSVDAYRDASNAAGYREQIRAYHRFGPPVAITEFGCCTYTGAAERGGSGWLIIDREAEPPALAGTYQRDEREQVRYYQELIEIFDTEGIDTAFWFSFAGFALPHRPGDARFDLDLASYGVVAVSDAASDAHPSGTWAPKEIFHAIAADFDERGSHRTSS